MYVCNINKQPCLTVFNKEKCELNILSVNLEKMHSIPLKSKFDNSCNVFVEDFSATNKYLALFYSHKSNMPSHTVSILNMENNQKEYQATIERITHFGVFFNKIGDPCLLVICNKDDFQNCKECYIYNFEEKTNRKILDIYLGGNVSQKETIPKYLNILANGYFVADFGLTLVLCNVDNNKYDILENTDMSIDQNIYGDNYTYATSQEFFIKISNDQKTVYSYNIKKDFKYTKNILWRNNKEQYLSYMIELSTDKTGENIIVFEIQKFLFSTIISTSEYLSNDPKSNIYSLLHAHFCKHNAMLFDLPASINGNKRIQRMLLDKYKKTSKHNPKFIAVHSTIDKKITNEVYALYQKSTVGILLKGTGSAKKSLLALFKPKDYTQIEIGNILKHFQEKKDKHFVVEEFVSYKHWKKTNAYTLYRFIIFFSKQNLFILPVHRSLYSLEEKNPIVKNPGYNKLDFTKLINLSGTIDQLFDSLLLQNNKPYADNLRKCIHNINYLLSKFIMSNKKLINVDEMRFQSGYSPTLSEKKQRYFKLGNSYCFTDAPYDFEDIFSSYYENFNISLRPNILAPDCK